MGGISVFTGKLTGTQIRSLLDGRISFPAGGRRIIVYTDKEATKPAFVIDFTKADDEVVEKFGREWSKQSNIHNRNADRSATSAEKEARKRTDPNTGEPVSAEDARKVGDQRRADATMEAVQKIVDARYPNVKVREVK